MKVSLLSKKHPFLTSLVIFFLFISIFSALFIPKTQATVGDITKFSIPATNDPSLSSSPYKIISGPDGNLWFAGYSDYRIGKVSTDGTITMYNLPSVNNPPNTHVPAPADITFGSDGNIWFPYFQYAPDGLSKIYKLDKMTTSGEITEYNAPNEGGDIISGPDGNLWVAEGSSNKIAKYNTTGVLLGEYELPTHINGGPKYLANGPDGNIWFTADDKKVCKITIDGVITEYLLSSDRAFPQFITKGSDNALWFTEQGENKVGRITTEGILTEISIPVSSPLGITSTVDGSLWVTEGAYPSHLTQLSTNGVVLRQYTIPEIPISDVQGPDGNLWFTLFYPTGKIGKLNLVEPNTPPSLYPLSNSSFFEGSTYSSTGSFTDSDSISWTGTVDYGDGSGIQPLSLNSDKTFALSHIYKDEGTYVVTVSITDNQGATTTATATITVNNAPFTVSSITAPTIPTPVNTSVTTSASFSDLGILDTHTASWTWGDGNITTGTVTESNGSGSITDSHIYTQAGVYTITLTVTDDDGLSVSSQYQYIVVYDPSDGFITGSGKIISPTDADIALPDATGEAKFGIQAKYTGNNTVPTGNTKFTFKNGNIDFNSTSYDWLVVNGSKAYLHGTGTVNGTGSYNFLISVIDGNPDTFRIKIKDNTTNTIVYDNQRDASDLTDPIEAIDSGQIKVH